MQVGRRKVRAKIGAVAPDRAVLHQPMFLEDLLAANDVRAGFRQTDSHGFADAAFATSDQGGFTREIE